MTSPVSLLALNVEPPVVEIAACSSRRALELIRAERSSIASCWSHRALEPTCPPVHFHPSDTGASATLFILLRLATPALRLGVLAGSWLRSEACVLPFWSATFGSLRVSALVCVVLQLYAV